MDTDAIIAQKDATIAEQNQQLLLLKSTVAKLESLRVQNFQSQQERGHRLTVQRSELRKGVLARVQRGIGGGY